MRGMTLIVKCITQLMTPSIFILGIYVVFHGHLTPGGGFAGSLGLADGLLAGRFPRGRFADGLADGCPSCALLPRGAASGAATCRLALL